MTLEPLTTSAPEKEEDYRFPDPRPFWWNDLVWVTNASRLLKCPRMQAWRETVRVGPPRPTYFLNVKQLQDLDIVGWYMPPIYTEGASAPAPKKPAHEAEQFALF